MIGKFYLKIRLLKTGRPSGDGRICCWPIDQRTRNAAGKPGKLHAKCAVIDSSAIISSANLMDDTFNRNLEMGILLRDGPTPDLIFSHFNALIDRGILREIRVD